MEKGLGTYRTAAAAAPGGWLTARCGGDAAHASECSAVLSRGVDKCFLEVISFFSFILHKEFLTLKTLFMNGKI